MKISKKLFQQSVIFEYQEHVCFVMLWVYFNSGIRVNEGAPYGGILSIGRKKEMRVNHMLLFKSKTNW